MFRKLLYPTDLTELSLKGLEWTARNLLRGDSELLIAHVVDPAGGTRTPEITHDAEQYLDSVSAGLSAKNIRNTVFLETGDADEILPDLAYSSGCSTSVLFVPRYEKVTPFVRMIPIPHFIAKCPEDRMPVDNPFGEVVLCTDLSYERTDSMLTQLRPLLEGFETRLTLLHSVALEEPQSSEEVFKAASEALEEVRLRVKEWNPLTEAVLASGQPEEEVLKQCSLIGAKLVIVGLSTHGELWNLLIGSTGETIIEHSEAPVLVLPV
ncbi:MAG: universal stress protein [Thermovirgaceae bacterium]